MDETNPDRSHDHDARPDPSHPAAGMPRWVKVFLAIGVTLLVLIVVGLLTGHGPGRHLQHGMQQHAAAVQRR